MVVPLRLPSALSPGASISRQTSPTLIIVPIGTCAGLPSVSVKAATFS